METVKGYVDHIIYKNTANGYVIFELMSDTLKTTCVGFLQDLNEGELLEVKGEYVDHSVYGKQLKIEEHHFVTPQDKLSIEKYLGSGAIKGIGPVLAHRVVECFGEDTFRIMEEEPERLAEIKGINERKAREIAEQLVEKKDMREAMIFLQQYGISNTLAMKIYNAYGKETYQIIKENPYRLAEEVGGIGFKIADEIARKIGIHMDSDYRVRSGILYVLLQENMNGHTYLPKHELLHKVSVLLGVDSEQIETQLMNLMMDKKIIIKTEKEGQHVYAAVYYYAEANCAKMIGDLNGVFLNETGGQPYNREAIEQKIDTLQKQIGFTLDTLQKLAIMESVQNGVFILTGGPGTGKTTTINVIIRFFEQEGMDIFLAAPTGRAAKRMTEATGYEAKTLHRLLELRGSSLEEGRKINFERNETNPLEIDILIVDEMSMVDIHLFQALLKALTPGTRLIMVGDMNQLPSVGPGQVLKDLLNSHTIKAVSLEKIFRQQEKSDIIVNAHLIHKGEMIQLDNKSKDFFFLERNDVNVIYKHMVELIQNKLPKYVDASPHEIQVLTPMRKGPLGIEELNPILQRFMNPSSTGKHECMRGNTIFREGDKVMQIKNNYQLEWEIVSKYGIPIERGVGVFNGDLGKMLEINDYTQTVIVEYEDQKRVTYPMVLLEELELAYATTIHKSQGSEYPAVIMPLLNGPSMLMNRNLLYTGITRAKNCVMILGSKRMIFDMISNNQEQARYTGLTARMIEYGDNL